MRLPSLCFLVFAVALIMSSCSRVPPTSWREEVLLASGELLTVERTQQWRVTHPLGSSVNYLPEQATLRLTGGMKPWNGFAESPLVLDKQGASAEWFLISIPRTCERYEQLGSPQPPYVEYRYRNGEWHRVPHPASARGRVPNLLVFPKLKDETPLVALREKTSRNSKLPFAEAAIDNASRMPAC